MQRKLLIIAALAAFGVSTGAHAKDEFGTQKEAEAMVVVAVAHIKKAGADTAYKDFTDKKAPFVDRDLYVVVYGMDGKPLAHGQNPKMVGKELMDMKDPDGKEFVKERVSLAKSKGKFWQEYKFTDPISKKVLPKQAYCEALSETIVCVGAYKH
jgi:signal transduction histidine kinase